MFRVYPNKEGVNVYCMNIVIGVADLQYTVYCFQGKKLNQHKLKMVYTAQKSVPVQRDHEVTEPSSEVSCQSATI